MRLSDAELDALMALPADGSEASGVGWRRATRLRHLSARGIVSYEVRDVSPKMSPNRKLAFWRLTPEGRALLNRILPAIEQ